MTDPFENQTQNTNLNKGRQSTRMIWPGHLRMPRFSDRIDPGADIEDLINSIREHGQKVPILVRRLPEGDMEIVFGVRRVLACLALRIDVRAEVKEMSDLEALIAKGIENNERLDLSPSRPEDAGDSPPYESQGCRYVDSVIDGDTLTFTVHTECQAELLDFLEDKITDLHAEWVRSRDQPVSASTLRSDEDA